MHHEVTQIKSCSTAQCFVSRALSIPYSQTSPLNLSTLASPVHPTSGILAHLLPARLPRQSRRRPAPHARLAVEHDLLVLLRTRVSEAVFEFLLCNMKAVGRRSDGDVDRVRDVAGGFKLAWFADICRGESAIFSSWTYSCGLLLVSEEARR